MRFSTIASSAALFGAAALALPNPEVVYETEVVTITSCGADVASCPGTYTTSVPVVEHPVATTSCTTTTSSYPVETPVEHPEYPVETPVEKPEETPVYNSPGEKTPVYESPKETPVYNSPEEKTPVYESPKETPVYNSPEEKTPVYESPKETPVYESPKETPVYNSPGEKTPVYETPAYETPVDTGYPTYPEHPAYVPSATGGVDYPVNTSSPVSPSVPVTYEGAASANSFSIVAVIAAAGALFLA